jgi:hypothetical protein
MGHGFDSRQRLKARHAGPGALLLIQLPKSARSCFRRFADALVGYFLHRVFLVNCPSERRGFGREGGTLVSFALFY